MSVREWLFLFFFKQKTAYEMRISDWSSDVCSSDLVASRANNVGGVSAGNQAVNIFSLQSRSDAGRLTTSAPALSARSSKYVVVTYSRSNGGSLRIRIAFSVPSSMTCVSPNSNQRFLSSNTVTRCAQIGSAPVRERVCQYL